MSHLCEPIANKCDDDGDIFIIATWLLETFTKAQDAGANQSLFNVTGVDISDEALKGAEKTVTEKVGDAIASKYFKTMQANIMEEDLDANKYDVIMCFFVQVCSYCVLYSCYCEGNDIVDLIYCEK